MLSVDGLKCWLAIRRRGLSEGRQPASPSWPTVEAPARASTCSASNTASARYRGRYPSQVNEDIFHLLGKIDERCRDEQDDASMSCRSLHLQLMAACCKSSCVAHAQALAPPPKKMEGQVASSRARQGSGLRPCRDGRHERLELLALVAPRMSDFLSGPGTLTFAVLESWSPGTERRGAGVALADLPHIA